MAASCRCSESLRSSWREPIFSFGDPSRDRLFCRHRSGQEFVSLRAPGQGARGEGAASIAVRRRLVSMQLRFWIPLTSCQPASRRSAVTSTLDRASSTWTWAYSRLSGSLKASSSDSELRPATCSTIPTSRTRTTFWVRFDVRSDQCHAADADQPLRRVPRIRFLSARRSGVGQADLLTSSTL